MDQGWEGTVPWLFVALAAISAIMIGRAFRRPQGGFSGWYFFGAAFIALGIGIAFTFATVATNTFCINTLRACVYHGDGNMSYWFHSFFAIPVFWGLLLVSAVYPHGTNRSMPTSLASDSPAKELSPVGEDLSNVDSFLLGHCPNCEQLLRLSATECSRCKAVFGEGSNWKVMGNVGQEIDRA